MAQDREVTDMAAREIEQVLVANVIVGARRRHVSDGAVVALAGSMREIGLQNPILVRYVEEAVLPDGEVLANAPVLIAGETRLRAAKSLGWEKIDAIEAKVDDIEAAMIEIAENLHRADLTALERAEQVAEWVRLAEERAAGISAQVGQKIGRGRPESGVSLASRKIGVTRQEAQRAEKIDSLAPEAKEAAIAAGLDKNQSALLDAAKAETPDAQVARIVEIQKRKEARKDLDAATDAVVKKDAAADLAAWMRERMDREEMPMVITWLEAVSTKDVIRALRREFMEGAA